MKIKSLNLFIPRRIFQSGPWVLTFFVLFSTPILWAENGGQNKKTPEQVLMEIQRDLVELDRQFEEIREELFFPKDEEILVYLRSNLKETFPVKMVDLMVNDKKVYRHTYSDSEKIAFNFSSLQPLYRFPMKPGQYQLGLLFTIQPDGNSKTRTQEYKFAVTKDKLPRFVEVELTYNRKQKALSFSEKVY